MLLRIMQTRNKNYLYLYFIIEKTGGDGESLLTTYRSNIPPPQIGSTIQVGEFTDQSNEYKVLEVLTTFHKATNIFLDDVSNSAHVRVVVRKIKDPFDDGF